MLREALSFEPGQEVMDLGGHRIRLLSLNLDVEHHDAARPLWVGIDLDAAYTTGDVVYTEAGYIDIVKSDYQAPTLPEHTETGAPGPSWATGRGLIDSKQALEELESTRHYAESAISQSTSQKYLKYWIQFERWCQDRGITPGTAASLKDIAIYISKAADNGLAPATIDVHVAAIRFGFRAKGQTLPDLGPNSPLALVLAGIRRKNARKPAKKEAMTVDVLRTVIETMDARFPALSGLPVLRDRALLLFGYASAMRRSELVALTVEDIADHDEGLIITIPRSKSDQNAKGARIAVPYGSTSLCPVLAIKAWIRHADIIEGPVFRRFTGRSTLTDQGLSPQTVAYIIKAWVRKAGLDPSPYSGHSLRRGWATDVAGIGDTGALMGHLRHSDIRTSLEYVQEARFTGHPGHSLL